MRRGSIAANLFILSACWLIAALVATAFLLTDLYSRALDTSLTETLEFHVETLIGATLESDSNKIGEDILSDPRFSRPASGWYWQVKTADNQTLGFSSSVVGSILPEMQVDFDTAGFRTKILTDAFGTKMRMLERRITIGDNTYFLTVTGNLDEIYALVADFRGQALIVLGAVGAMLAIMSAIVARFALRPIIRLRKAVEHVREGEAQTVDGEFPAEIAPLADEINELLRSNTQIIERARSQVGNLAHGLKTPLAVLRNEAAGNKTGMARIVLAETEKMSAQVSSYLNRAQLAARTSIVGKRADAGLVMERLVRAMRKIHPESQLDADLPETGSVWFRGEEGDFEEMAGNLVDNACKWAKGQVAVQLHQETGTSGNQLVMMIDDDGPGLTEEQAKLALKRGVRLDEKTSGSGLGLDIVKELVDVYGGSLKMGRSERGGLRVMLTLPTARSKSN